MKGVNSVIHCRMRTAPHSIMPDLIVACVVGDVSRNRPARHSWHSNKFLIRIPLWSGAAHPHLNGYKNCRSTVLARIDHDELDQAFSALRLQTYFVEGDDPLKIHLLLRRPSIPSSQRLKTFR